MHNGFRRAVLIRYYTSDGVGHEPVPSAVVLQRSMPACTHHQAFRRTVLMGTAIAWFPGSIEVVIVGVIMSVIK